MSNRVSNNVVVSVRLLETTIKDLKTPEIDFVQWDLDLIVIWRLVKFRHKSSGRTW